MDEELSMIYKDIAERDYGSMKNEVMKSIIRRVKGSEIIMGETYSKFDEIMEKYAAISRQEEKELTKGEFKRLVEAARHQGKEQLALCMETIAVTGIRISELQYFTVERVKKGRIEIINKGKYRRIFLPDSLLSATGPCLWALSRISGTVATAFSPAAGESGLT